MLTVPDDERTKTMSASTAPAAGAALRWSRAERLARRRRCSATGIYRPPCCGGRCRRRAARPVPGRRAFSPELRRLAQFERSLIAASRGREPTGEPLRAAAGRGFATERLMERASGRNGCLLRFSDARRCFRLHPRLAVAGGRDASLHAARPGRAPPRMLRLRPLPRASRSGCCGPPPVSRCSRLAGGIPPWRRAGAPRHRMAAGLRRGLSARTGAREIPVHLPVFAPQRDPGRCACSRLPAPGRPCRRSRSLCRHLILHCAIFGTIASQN